jgi:hypothetical protein
MDARKHHPNDEDGAFLLDEEKATEEEENENAGQRDLGSDEFDGDPTDSIEDDRVRGAGRQSLDQLTIEREEGWGLEEGRGGLRADRPDQSVNEEEDEARDSA